MSTIQKSAKPKKLYGAFRAYCFMNFACIALVCIIMTFMMFGEDAAAGMGCLVVTIGMVGLCWLIWLPVAKKVDKADRLKVFGWFVVYSLLVFAKVLLCCTVILIPLVKAITAAPYEMRTDSLGRDVYVRSIGNGEYEDSLGNRYNESN